MAIHIEQETDASACVIHLDGDVDTSVVPAIRDAMSATIGAGCTNMVLDLARVTYADSSALGLLVWIDHQLSPYGGKLVLVGANRDVTRILELSGLVGMAPSISANSTVQAAIEGLELPAAAREELWAETLTLPAQVESLSEVRTRIVELLQPLDLSEATLFDVKVAVGEALANAVRHGSPGGATDEVSVEVTAYLDRVVIKVRDSGCGFTGDASCTGDVFASGGRGVMFMRALMDRVTFKPGIEGGTVVTLVKHRRPGATRPR